MKVSIVHSFAYHGYSVMFKKEVNLPFAPFFGLQLLFSEEGESLEVDLTFTNLRRVTIKWDEYAKMFLVTVINVWNNPVPESEVERIINTHAKLHWWVDLSLHSLLIKSMEHDANKDGNP